MKASRISFVVFIIGFLLGNLTVRSQDYVKYEYDFAGNRVLRQVIIIPPKLTPADSLEVSLQTVTENHNLATSDKLGDCQVKIYPNPTGGAFTLEIAGSYDVNTALLSVYSTEGIELDCWKHLLESNSLDISTFPSGNYILKLSLNGYSTSWKLIKE